VCAYIHVLAMTHVNYQTLICYLRVITMSRTLAMYTFSEMTLITQVFIENRHFTKGV